MISDIFQNYDRMRMLILAQNLFKPGGTGWQDGLMGLYRVSASCLPTFMHPKGDIAQYFTGQKLVKWFGQLLGIIDPGQPEVLGPPNIHVRVHFRSLTLLKCFFEFPVLLINIVRLHGWVAWILYMVDLSSFGNKGYWEQTLKCRHILSNAPLSRLLLLLW